MTSTVFVLHLAFVDLVYCVFCLPSYWFGFNHTFWPYGDYYCKLTIALVMVTEHANWFCLGMIAITRCLGLVVKKFWDDFCKWTNVLAILMSSWLWVIAIDWPLWIDRSLAFGFHCKMGKCDVMATGLNSTLPVPLSMVVTWFIPHACTLFFVQFVHIMF